MDFHQACMNVSLGQAKGLIVLFVNHDDNLNGLICNISQ